MLTISIDYERRGAASQHRRVRLPRCIDFLTDHKNGLVVSLQTSTGYVRDPKSDHAA
jgi:hypothetical protein